MNKALLIVSILLFNCIANSQTFSTKIFDQITFYDGYAAVSAEPIPDGVIRHRNDLYSTKLTPLQLQSFGSTLTAKVTIKASCDNYDRIGNVNLALVPKDASTYIPAIVQRIELGRFITPFMNKNKTPNEVSYTFTIDNIAKIFKDATIMASYDFWMELEVFGVPYAANTEIVGCTGRKDVFFGTLELISNTTPLTSSDNFLLPLNFKKNLNNYQAGASDAIGTTIRTINFNLPNAVTGAALYLITSNHGAGTNGEEYSRRWHYVTFDNLAKLTYRPGETSCEPYRVYNTQADGIYGPTPRTDESWQSFSNWCPGAKISTKVITLGNLSAGNHSFKISVPDAVFYNKDGYIPVSLYLQGKSTGFGLNDENITVYSLFPNPTSNTDTINSLEEVKDVKIYNMLGQKIWQGNSNKVDLTNAEHGIYNAIIQFGNDRTVSHKIIRN